MGRSTPVMKTRCAQCLKKRKNWRDGSVPSGEVIGYSPKGYPRLKCQRCGHIWISRSIVGRRMRIQHERKVSSQ